MPFDISGARKAGYSDEQIVDALKGAGDKGFKFDYDGAISAGYSPSQILEAIEKKHPRQLSEDISDIYSQGKKELTNAVEGKPRPESPETAAYLSRLGVSSPDEARKLQDQALANPEGPVATVASALTKATRPISEGLARVQQGVQGAMGMATSPVAGFNRFHVSRPLSETTGIPMESIENAEGTVAGVLGAGSQLGKMLGGGLRAGVAKPLGLSDAELEADVTKRYDALRANKDTVPADAAKTAANNTASKVYSAGVGDAPTEQMLGRVWKTVSAKDEVPVRSLINLHRDIIASDEIHPVAQAIMAKDLQSLLQDHAPEAALQNLEAADSYKALLASRTIENAQQRARASGDTTGNYLTQLRVIAKNPLDPTKSNTFRERMTPETQKMLDDIVEGRSGGAKSTAVGRALGGDRGLGSIIGPWIAESATRHLTGIPLLGGIVGGAVGRIGTEIGNQALKGSIRDLGESIRAGTPLGRQGPSMPWNPTQGPPPPPLMLPAPGRPIGAPPTPGGIAIPPAPVGPASQIATTSGLPLNRAAPSVAQPGRISGPINILDQIARGPSPIPQRALPPPAPPAPGPAASLPGPQPGPPVPQPGTTVSPGSLNPFANIPAFIREVPKLRDANGRFKKKKKE